MGCSAHPEVIARIGTLERCNARFGICFYRSCMYGVSIRAAPIPVTAGHGYAQAFKVFFWWPVGFA
jgi:hypothetical protein